ncbi:MAG: efflux RND transporter periplasmic adaptor subunit [Patescibacteria group bacterium]
MKKSLLITAAVLTIAVVVGAVFFNSKKKITYDFITVKPQTLIQEVNVTGQIKPARNVDLAFEKGGKVSQIYVKVGDKIDENQKLIELINADLAAQLAKARAVAESAEAGALSAQAQIENVGAALLQYSAALDKEQAKLQELQKGTRKEELQVAQSKVVQAEQSLADAQKNLIGIKAKAQTDLDNLYQEIIDIVNKAYNSGDEAINKYVKDLFNKTGASYELSFSTSNSQAKSDAEWQRLTVEQVLSAWKSELGNISSKSNYDDLDQILVLSENHLTVIKDFLVKTTDVLNSAISTGTVTETTLSTYRTSVMTARANINTEITSINSQKQSIAAQKATNQNNITAAETDVNAKQNALNVARDELTLKQAGTEPEQIAAQQAAISQAQANVSSQEAAVRKAQADLKSQQAQIKQAQAEAQNIQAQIDKTVLRAPIAGIVTKCDIEIGEIAGANAVVVSLISQTKFKIEANVPEADIAKLQIGQTARVDLDAYGDDQEWQAKVISIDPAETIIDGVATYKVDLQFADEDQRIKSGMTANLDILTAERAGIIAVPARAVISRNGDKFARILMEDDGQIVKEVPVKTGLRGSDGNVEILQGLAEGDRVVVYEGEE